MRIQFDPAGDVRSAVATMRDLQGMRVSAPQHPLADAHGQVPIEVFEVPPELVDVVRTLPIRSMAATPVELPPEPMPARVAAEPLIGGIVDVDA